MVNGRNFTDGSTTLPFPEKKVLESFDPTDMFVIANCSQANASIPPSWIRKVLITLFTTGLSPKVRVLVVGRSDLWTENLEYLRGHTANVGILWGPNSIGGLTLDYQRLRSTVGEGARKTLAIFGQPELPFSLLYRPRGAMVFSFLKELLFLRLKFVIISVIRFANSWI